MRRIAVLLSAPLLAVAPLAVAACGSSGPSTPSVSVSGSFGKSPTISIPSQTAGSNLTVKTLIQGSGPVLSKSDAFVGNYAVYIWSGKTHKLAQSTFQTKTPQLFSGTLLPGLESALQGKKMGSRVLAVIPPKDGYGKTGNSSAGVSATDTLVFVIDMIKEFANNAAATGSQVSNGGGSLPTVTAKSGAAPVITIPSSAHKPPTALVTKTLIKGSGPKLVKGQFVIAQYAGYIWRTKKVFDSSWTSGSPFGFVMDASPEQVISGWDSGLVGQTVGSRVMLVIPPKDAYGTSGASQAGINGKDTLVFVVDIIDALKPTTS